MKSNYTLNQVSNKFKKIFGNDEDWVYALNQDIISVYDCEHFTLKGIHGRKTNHYYVEVEENNYDHLLFELIVNKDEDKNSITYILFVTKTDTFCKLGKMVTNRNVIFKKSFSKDKLLENKKINERFIYNDRSYGISLKLIDNRKKLMSMVVLDFADFINNFSFIYNNYIITDKNKIYSNKSIDNIDDRLVIIPSESNYTVTRI